MRGGTDREQRLKIGWQVVKGAELSIFKNYNNSDSLIHKVFSNNGLHWAVKRIDGLNNPSSSLKARMGCKSHPA